MNLYVAFIALLLITISNIASADFLRIIDDGNPISIDLELKKEVQLQFDKNLSTVGIPNTLHNYIEVQSIDTRVYLKAHKAFNPTKFLIKDGNGQLSTLLLSASSKTTTYKNYKIAKRQQNIPKVTALRANTKTTANLVDLTRFVAQTFYAAQRLVKQIKGVYRVPVVSKKVELFVCSANLACNGNITAKPQASWQNNKYVITAIKLDNITNRSISLDPRDIVGQWLSATFQFNTLSPADTTMLYLVSYKRFEQSL